MQGDQQVGQHKQLNLLPLSLIGRVRDFDPRSAGSIPAGVANSPLAKW